MKQFLYFVTVSISSYFTGVISYIGMQLLLGFIYGQSFEYAENLIYLTAASFLFIVIPLYLFIHYLLLHYNLSYFWLRTLIFIIVGIIPTFIAFFLMGFMMYTSSFFKSIIMIPYYAFFTGTAIVFSVGCWANNIKRIKIFYIIVSILISISAIIIYQIVN